MKVLFSNRWAPLGMFLSLTLIALLEYDAAERVQRARPDFRWCLAAPDLYHGSIVDLHGDLVAPGVICAEEINVHIKGLPDAPLGTRFSILGRFDRDAYIETQAVVTIPDYSWRRKVMYGLSFAVLTALVMLLHRRLTSSLHEGLLVLRTERN